MRKTGFKKRVTKTFMPFIFGYQWQISMALANFYGAHNWKGY